MKRTPVVLLASGALVAAITGTALASGGDDDVTPSRGASSAATASVVTPSATASSAPSAGDPAASPTASPSGPASWSSRPPSGSASGAPGTGVDGRRAGRIALAHVGGGTITRIESGTEHGRAVWSVRIVRDGARYDIDVDRADGGITRSRAKSDDGSAGGHHRGGGDDDGGSGRHGRHHG